MRLDKTNISLLLNQLRQGNEIAFSKIYDHFSPQLYQTILYLVKDKAIADELLQDTFLHVWKQKELIEPEKTFWPYLYRVARWFTHNHFKKVATDKKLLDYIIINSVDHVINAEDLMIKAEIHALLAKAIDNLPPKRQQVFKLCKIEGKSYQEVSEILDISTDTIRNQIKAANKSLKEYFLTHKDLAILVIACAATSLIVSPLPLNL